MYIHRCVDGNFVGFTSPINRKIWTLRPTTSNATTLKVPYSLSTTTAYTHTHTSASAPDRTHTAIECDWRNQIWCVVHLKSVWNQYVFVCLCHSYSVFRQTYFSYWRLLFVCACMSVCVYIGYDAMILTRVVFHVVQLVRLLLLTYSYSTFI